MKNNTKKPSKFKMYTNEDFEELSDPKYEKSEKEEPSSEKEEASS